MDTIENTRPRASITESFYCLIDEATHAIAFDGASGATVWYGVVEADARTFGRKEGFDRVARIVDEPALIPGERKRKRAAWWVAPLGMLLYVAAFWAAIIGTNWFTTALPLPVTIVLVALTMIGHGLFAIWESRRLGGRS